MSSFGEGVKGLGEAGLCSPLGERRAGCYVWKEVAFVNRKQRFCLDQCEFWRDETVEARFSGFGCVISEWFEVDRVFARFDCASEEVPGCEGIGWRFSALASLELTQLDLSCVGARVKGDFERSGTTLVNPDR